MYAYTNTVYGLAWALANPESSCLADEAHFRYPAAAETQTQGTEASVQGHLHLRALESRVSLEFEKNEKAWHRRLQSV